MADDQPLEEPDARGYRLVETGEPGSSGDPGDDIFLFSSQGAEAVGEDGWTNEAALEERAFRAGSHLGETHLVERC